MEIGAGTTTGGGAITSGPVGTGTLTLGNGATIQGDGTPWTLANALSLSGTVTFGGTSGLTFDPTGTSPATVTTLTGDTTLTVNNTTTINESITGGHNLTINGTGTLILGTANSYTGTTTVTTAARCNWASPTCCRRGQAPRPP